MHLLFLLLFSIITNEGPFMDPNGGRAVVRGLDSGDGRSIIDPIGRARTNSGVCIDPNGGRCSRGFAGDSGGGMDPNG